MSRCFCLQGLVLFLASALWAQNSSPAASVPASVPDLLKQAGHDYYTGQFGSAIQGYQAALKQDSKSASAYAGLTRIYLKQQKVTLAAETANQGVAQVPESPLVHTALGEVYFRQGKMAESEKEFLNAINVPHLDPRACMGLSRIYDVYSLHASAKRMLDRAHELAPDDPEIRRRWIGTQKRSEQIKWLQNYLAGPGNDDPDQRRALEEWLGFLEEREKQPHHSCKLVTNLASTETQLLRLADPTHFYGFGLDVKVNGHSTKLELDTGASGLLISKGLAAKAGIEPVSTIHFTGIGNQRDPSGFVGYANSIKVGHLEFHDCLVTVSDKNTNLQVDGLIGADVLSHYLVTIDFPREKLRLDELPKRPGEKEESATLATEDEESPVGDDQTDKSGSAATDSGPQDAYVAPEMKSYTKIFRFGHGLLIPTSVSDTPTKLFLIDTGAMLNNISPEAAREVTKIHGDSNTQVMGIGGSVNKVYRADQAVLQFSHFRQVNQDLITFDLSGLSKTIGTEVSGILGVPVLGRLTIKIDYRDGLVDFAYQGPSLR